MNPSVLTTTAANGIAVITLGSAGRIYFDAEMGDALTEALDGFAGNANVRVVVSPAARRVISIVTSISHPLLRSRSPSGSPVASGPRTRPTTGDSSTKLWRCVRACQSR